MRYVFIMSEGIAVGKAINYTDVKYDNEIEVTQEQYEQTNTFPLISTINDEGKVLWNATEYYPSKLEVIKELTIEEKLALAEDTINFLLGL
ncbi:hypothetical protein J2Z76_002706 [Sedimentibacter acidaminivorans]|uniref:Phage protein n=1 Tax=Sedimentibacter acidaminivorans TaxID=913099 RepID=A0ABS4GGN5_9FIRM|nr:hypothetical protein [Sedimentibacter acidaminivorans]MBP1926836.1 hypothetical protein [Sedimentibacter acidaminivorans]